MATSNSMVLHDIPPYLKVYKDGTIERFIGTEKTPPGFDPQTCVFSKDIIIQPQTGLSVRVYHPENSNPKHKKLLPILVYFHGGAFCISSTADPKYHTILNMLSSQANIIIVSVDYRKAPENPLPAAYDDAWAALRWLGNLGHDELKWLEEEGIVIDYGKVFIGGDSAGANITHHVAMKLGKKPSKTNGFNRDLKIVGLLMIHPYFWGEEAIGIEAENPVMKAVVDQWWRFVCPSEKGNNDPLINPFVGGIGSFSALGCEKMVVCVAGSDILRERGRLYYEALVKSKWHGKLELFETQGEDHVFHIIDPYSEKSQSLIKRLASFINQD